ncbi:diacylglycerol/lipid kinase family protein [Nocardioides pacificus]
MRAFTLLVNPTSGGGAAPGAVVPAARLLRDAGARVDVTYSPGPLACADLVDAAVARGDVVVSVGGDGMLSSLAGRVASAGGTLGLLPAGRGNDFARMLGLPEDVTGQVEVLLSAAPRRVDLLELQLPGSACRTVAGSVYAGVDARAAAYVARMRRVPRQAQYPLGAVAALATYRPARFRVVVDGPEGRHEAEYDAATVVVANSRFYGKGMAIAPDASLDDGLLDLIVVEAAHKRALIRALPRLYDGSHVDLPEVTVMRGTRIELSADSRAVVPLGGDGEPLGELPRLGAEPAILEVRPGVLDVLAPAASDPAR